MPTIKYTTPIAFFAYKRPEHTLRALESLEQNCGSKFSKLYIFCDGAISEVDRIAVEKVRKIARSRQWCGTVHVVESDHNMGLANSIIAGVTRLCDEFGRVIVLEDDLITSPYFLDYMNSALDLYEEDSRVMQVSGYMFPVKNYRPDEVFFLPFTTSWGWGTWDRAWNCFDPNMKQYNNLISNTQLVRKFNLLGAYPYSAMLKNQIDGEIDSWAIRWYLSVFMMKGFVLYPKCTLVQNIGFDGSGTHSNKNEVSVDRLCKNPLNVTTSGIVICNESFDRIREYLTSKKRSGVPSLKKILLEVRNYCRRFSKE